MAFDLHDRALWHLWTARCSKLCSGARTGIFMTESCLFLMQCHLGPKDDRHLIFIVFFILVNLTFLPLRDSSSSPTGRGAEVPHQLLWIAAIQVNETRTRRARTHFSARDTHQVSFGVWPLVDYDLHTAHPVAGKMKMGNEVKFQNKAPPVGSDSYVDFTLTRRDCM